MAFMKGEFWTEVLGLYIAAHDLPFVSWTVDRARPAVCQIVPHPEELGFEASLPSFYLPTKIIQGFKSA
jgi:hypothetical protein